MELIDLLLAWTDGKLSEEGVIGLFQRLIDSGLAWELEGHIGRCAHDLIMSGHCTPPRPTRQAVADRLAWL